MEDHNHDLDAKAGEKGEVNVQKEEKEEANEVNKDHAQRHELSQWVKQPLLLRPNGQDQTDLPAPRITRRRFASAVAVEAT